MHPSRAARLALYAVLALSLVVLPLLTAVAGPSPPAFVIIVDPNNPHRSLDRKFIGDAFLKKTTRWPNGDVIRPVDLHPDSPVREKFSHDILKRSVAAVKSYWQQVIFSGRDVPPPELASDDEVVKYVLKNAGAIGYVSGTARVGNARVVTVE